MTLTVLLLTLVGCLGGTLLGLIGIGTTLLAIPAMLFVLPLAGVPPSLVPLTSVATSISAVAVATLFSLRAHLRHGNVAGAVVRAVIPGSLVGVAAGSQAARYLPGDVLRFGFAALLLYVAVRMWLRGRRGGPPDPPMPQAPSRTKCVAAGTAFGFTGALVGGGGNVFMVPFLRRQSLPMSRAVGTATAIALPVSFFGAALFALAPEPAGVAFMLGQIHLPSFAALAVGNAIGGPFGARLGIHATSKHLERLFSVLLVALAIRLLLP